MDSDFSFFGLDTGGGFEMRLCCAGAGTGAARLGSSTPRRITGS